MSHLADDCHLVADVRERRLRRSTESRTCIVTQTHSTFADRAFAAAGARLWNSLPPHLWDADLPYSRFRRSLKTFLFGQLGHSAVWTIITVPPRNNLTYLLTIYTTFNQKPSSVVKVSSKHQFIVQVEVSCQFPDVWLTIRRFEHPKEQVDCTLLVTVWTKQQWN